MRNSSIRAFSRTLSRALLAPADGAACPGAVGKAAPTGAGAAALPPVRYHVFSTPLPYPVGLALQSRVIEERLKRRERGESSAQDVLFLLEHTPTYTTGRRDNTPNPDQLHPEEAKVVDVGAGFYITKRGGQVTYHGPGQVVGYPLLDLAAMGTPTRCYVEYLQALLAEYARSLGLVVDAPHKDGHVGVFASDAEKVASIGIHLRHRITSHGFAMNVTEEPVPWFDLVTACGLADVRAVSLSGMLDKKNASRGGGAATPPSPSLSVSDVCTALIPRFAETFSRAFVPLAAPVDAASGADEAEVEGIRAIVAETEAAAAEALKDAGTWPTRPRVKDV